MTLAVRYASEKIDGLVARFASEASGYVPPMYCRTRRHEFLLQRMLLPDVFGRHYEQALDIGCGVGLKSLLLGDVARVVHGVDIDTPYHGFVGHEPAAVAGQKILDAIGCTWATLTAANDFGEFLRERERRYDLITSDYVVEHIADVPSLHSAILHALRPGGTVVHTIPNTHDAIEQFIRLNLRPSLRELAKAFAGLLRPGRRAQKITVLGTLAPIPHSEFLSDYGRQFDVYRIEHNLFSMIDAGFEIATVVPTREHSYTVVARRPE
jgi:2-polyprenyl-3-methyl-5-hydroxy-6-metoxy-1,4-benzoquinol methylase